MTKTILITGAGGGIGRACIDHFSRHGWRVIGVDRSDYGDGFPKNGRFIKADISQPDSVEQNQVFMGTEHKGSEANRSRPLRAIAGHAAIATGPGNPNRFVGSDHRFPSIAAVVDNIRGPSRAGYTTSRSSAPDQARMSEHAKPTLPNPALVLLLPAAACSAALTAAVARVTGASVHLRPPQQAWRDEFSALRQEFPDATLLRVREARLWLADDALLRLLKAAAAAPGR